MNRRLFLFVTLPLLYPIIDTPAMAQTVPVIQELQKLTASDADARNHFGQFVSISGDVLVVGAHLDSDHGAESGSAYVFERDAEGVWSQVQKLTASDAAFSDQFGAAVSVSGDTIIVGASDDDDLGSASGSVYVFERGPDGSWPEVQKINASDGAPADRFGISVSISGERLIVGAYLDDVFGLVDAGAAYIFERDAAGMWIEAQRVFASDPEVSNFFGTVVSMSAERAVIGTPFDGLNAGSAYLFERDATGTWLEIEKLTASDAANSDRFATSVSISGEKLVVGAPSDDDGGNGSGAAYVYERDASGSWREVQKIRSADNAPADAFGISVAVDGNHLVAGAHLDDDAGLNSGSAYGFERDALGTWSEIEKLTASDAALRDDFGIAVSLSGDTAVVGAAWDDDACPTDPNCNSGAVYVFALQSSTPPPATGPTLSIPERIPTAADAAVGVPIVFNGNDHEIAATTFSVDYDESCLDFDPTDGDGDGTPDAVVFSLPGDFARSVTFAAGDTSGEFDFAIADFSTPLIGLPDGVIAVITFTPTCSPIDTAILAPVEFGLTPVASFGDTAGQSVPGTTVGGSVEILPGIPGDCNGDGVVDAGDISACVLEVFDGDGNVWTDVVNGSFPGSPVGCDANQDFLVDAGDFSCKILLIFNGAGACSPPPFLDLGGAGSDLPGPELRAGQAWSQAAGEKVEIPLTFSGNGHAIAASAFSIDYDETCLSFDPSDGVATNLPSGMIHSVSFDAGDTEGELDISLLDATLPLSPLPDGRIATLIFTTQCDPGEAGLHAAVRFGAEPPLSFGDVFGRGVQGAGVDGYVTLAAPLFNDGFESGDVSGWSSTPR